MMLAALPGFMSCDLGPSSNATAAELPTSAEEGRRTTIGGKVVDESGSPIADAAVRLFELRVEPHHLRWDALPHVEAHTNANGAFKFDSVPVGYMTPAMVQYNQVSKVLEARQATLTAAYHANPERFARPPRPPAVPEQVWINPPAKKRTPEVAAQSTIVTPARLDPRSGDPITASPAGERLPDWS